MYVHWAPGVGACQCLQFYGAILPQCVVKIVEDDHQIDVAVTVRVTPGNRPEQHHPSRSLPGHHLCSPFRLLQRGKQNLYQQLPSREFGDRDGGRLQLSSTLQAAAKDHEGDEEVQ